MVPNVPMPMQALGEKEAPTDRFQGSAIPGWPPCPWSFRIPPNTPDIPEPRPSESPEPGSAPVCEVDAMEAEEIQVISIAASWTGAIYAPRPGYPTPGDCPSPSLPPWSYTGPPRRLGQGSGQSLGNLFTAHCQSTTEPNWNIYIYFVRYPNF